MPWCRAATSSRRRRTPAPSCSLGRAQARGRQAVEDLQRPAAAVQGPQAGFGEILLPPMQAGSSIMPGKVNPVIPEVVNQVAFEVIGNDVTVTMAAEAGQLQLNAFEPIIGSVAAQERRHLRQACRTLRVNCVDGIAGQPRAARAAGRRVGDVVTALNPSVGYDKAAAVAKGLQRSPTARRSPTPPRRWA